MDVEQMSIQELEAQHQQLDEQVVECRRVQAILHDEIVRKEQAAFVPGPSYLRQTL